MNPATVNGGFPLPPDGEAVRVVASRHFACDGETRVRLPRELPARAVRRVVCRSCAQFYEATGVEEVGERSEPVAAVAPAPVALTATKAPRFRRPAPALPRLDWRWLSLPVAALAVFVVLSRLQGDDATSTAPVSAAVSSEAQPVKDQKRPGRGRDGAAGASVVPGDAQVISESTFSVALPPGWDRVNPSSGATFAAVAPDGLADATLWIQRDPKLDFATFEANSLVQLESLAGSAEVVERDAGPSLEASSIKIAPADTPRGAPTYEVILRGAGDYWYYLATTHQASAPAAAVEGAELIQGSFIPAGSKG